eukprot:10192.XXX_327107_327307_1 [CDS] Oithona nana genome sequencing.
MLHIPQMLLKQESQADKQLTQVCLLQLEHFLGTSSDKVLTHEVHELVGLLLGPFCLPPSMTNCNVL